MEMPPSSVFPTMVQNIPTFMPSGSRFLERFEDVPSDATITTLPAYDSRPASAAGSFRRTLPNVPLDKVPYGSALMMQKPSFLKRHGPMIATVVLTTIVFGLFISQAKSSEKLFPISAGLLIAFSAISIYQRYYYSPCLTGQPWTGYLSIGSLFTSMVLLGIWIGKTK